MEKIQSLRNEIIGRTNKFFDEDKKKAKDSWYDAQEKANSTNNNVNSILKTDIKINKPKVTK